MYVYDIRINIDISIEILVVCIYQIWINRKLMIELFYFPDKTYLVFLFLKILKVRNSVILIVVSKV